MRPLRTASALTGASLAEYPPSPRVASTVACSWEHDPADSTRVQVLPDGSSDLVWDGSRLRMTTVGVTSAEYLIAAPSVGLRLRIGAAGAVLGAPADELLPDGVYLDEVWGADARRWERRLGHAPDAAAARAVLEVAVLDRLAHGDRDRSVFAAVALVSSGHTVDDAARRTGYSPREMRRLFHREAGLGPKSLQRVIRFERFTAALGSVVAGTTSLALVASASGYADQSHLSRECRAIAATTPTKLVARWSRHDPVRGIAAAAPSRASVTDQR